MKHDTINVDGMMCSMCSRSVEKAAYAAGSESARVNLMLKTLTVSYDDSKTNIKDIMRSVSKAGYKPYPPERILRRFFFTVLYAESSFLCFCCRFIIRICTHSYSKII